MPRHALRLKLYVLGEVLPLSASLPVFENLGLKVIAEDSFPVSFNARRRLAAGSGDPGFHYGARRRRCRPSWTTSARRWKTPSMRCCAGEAESDGFNQLVIGAGLAWRDVAILRAVGEIPAPGGDHLQPGLYGAGAGAQSGHRRAAGRAVPCPQRSAAPDEPRRAASPTIENRIEAALNDVP